MKLLIFSRAMAQNADTVAGLVTETCIWISIASPGLSQAKIAHSGHVKAILPVWFDDTRPKDEFNDGLIPMLETHAKMIVDFVNQHKHDVGLICVNCEAGICRSSAVAMAISQWLNGHDSGIMDSDQYYPNSHVVKMMNKAIEQLS